MKSRLGLFVLITKTSLRAIINTIGCCCGVSVVLAPSTYMFWLTYLLLFSPQTDFCLIFNSLQVLLRSVVGCEISVRLMQRADDNKRSSSD